MNEAVGLLIEAAPPNTGADEPPKTGAAPPNTGADEPPKTGAPLPANNE